MAAPAYETTEVAVSKSQQEIRTILKRYGADRFTFAEEAGLAEVGFRSGARLVRLRVPITPMTEEAAIAWARAKGGGISKQRAVDERDDRAERRTWRVLFWLIKSRMEAIAAGVETLDEAFLAHLVDPATDMTVYETMSERGLLKQLEAGDG